MAILQIADDTFIEKSFAGLKNRPVGHDENAVVFALGRQEIGGSESYPKVCTGLYCGGIGFYQQFAIQAAFGG